MMGYGLATATSLYNGGECGMVPCVLIHIRSPRLLLAFSLSLLVHLFLSFCLPLLSLGRSHLSLSHVSVSSQSVSDSDSALPNNTGNGQPNAPQRAHI